MKKVILILLALLIITGCSSENVESSDDSTIKIGVLQLMDHESLNSAYEGFKDALKDNGYEVCISDHGSIFSQSRV